MQFYIVYIFLRGMNVFISKYFQMYFIELFVFNSGTLFLDNTSIITFLGLIP